MERRIACLFLKKHTTQYFYQAFVSVISGSFMKEFKITSPAFESNKQIPGKYVCSNQATNPPLSFEGIPEETKSVALIIDDPDAPGGTFAHWVVWNISPSTNKIAEHAVPGTQGLNSSGEHGYTGPCPPSGTHRYFFKVYALDMELELGANSKKQDLEKAMQDTSWLRENS
jgi:Raf kinase inhibitor-like YbhB/YbcL family protein